MEIREKNGTENVVAYHLSRLTGVKKKELSLHDSFPDDNLFVLI